MKTYKKLIAVFLAFFLMTSCSEIIEPISDTDKLVNNDITNTKTEDTSEEEALNPIGVATDPDPIVTAEEAAVTEQTTPEQTVTTAQTTTTQTTTQAPVVTTTVTTAVQFTDLSKTMYAIGNPVNVRESYSTDSTRLGSIQYAEQVTVTGVSNELGWHRVLYNNQVAYIKSDLLSDTKPAVQTTTTTAQAVATQAPVVTTKAQANNQSEIPVDSKGRPLIDANTGLPIRYKDSDEAESAARQQDEDVEKWLEENPNWGGDFSN